MLPDAQNRNISFKIKSYLMEYYFDDLQYILAVPELQSDSVVKINVVHLAAKAPSIAVELIRHPFPVYSCIKRALIAVQEDLIRSSGPTSTFTIKNIPIEIESLPYYLDGRQVLLNPKLGNLRSCHVGKVLCVGGTVQSSGPPLFVEVSREYSCKKCGQEFNECADPMLGETLKTPYRCPNQECPSHKESYKEKQKNKKYKQFVLLQGSEIRIPYQELKLQPRVSGGGQGSDAMPTSLAVTVQDSLVDKCQVGDDVEITGVLGVQHHGTLMPDMWCASELVIYAWSVVKCSDSALERQITQQDEERYLAYWREHSTCPMRGRDKIINSMCSQVHGMFKVKLSILLMLASGRAASQTKQDSTNIRGNVHVLCVGDPGTGKSQIMKQVNKLSERCVQSTGTGVSGVGLTAAAVKDSTGSWVLQAGALVLADGGVCCIDEVGCVSNDHLLKLHEAMEQQTITINKAGMCTSLPTRTSILGVMNPATPYNKASQTSSSYMEQLTGLPASILSRFDLVLLLPDLRNPVWDSTVAGHILDIHTVYNPRTGKACGGAEPAWTTDDLRNYLQYIRSRAVPKVSNEAELLIKDYYSCCRCMSQRDRSRCTVRLLESLIRLAQAHARLMCRNVVADVDAVNAILLMDMSMGGGRLLGSSFTNDMLMDTGADDPDEAAQQLLIDVQNAIKVARMN